MYTKKLQLVNMFVHSANGPPQFADDTDRVYSRDATGPATWSPLNEYRFFEDDFRHTTLTGLIAALNETRPELRALIPISAPPTSTTTALVAGDVSSPELNAAVDPEASEFFRVLWEEMFQKQLITMFSSSGTY